MAMRNHSVLGVQIPEDALLNVKEFGIRKAIKVGESTVEVQSMIWRAWDQRWSPADIEGRINAARQLVNATLKAEVLAMTADPQIVDAEAELRAKIERRGLRHSRLM